MHIDPEAKWVTNYEIYAPKAETENAPLSASIDCFVVIVVVAR